MRCSIDGCQKPHNARGLCATHYSRLRRTGDPGPATALKMRRDARCAVAACSRATLARGLCQLHYDRLRFTGAIGSRCMYCGEDLTNRSRSRKFCSRAHGAMYRRHDGVRVAEVTCGRCGDRVNLTGTGAAGRTKRADTKICDACRAARSTRHGRSVKALVAAHGVTDCGICGEPVDLSLTGPNLMRASVDHIVPYAHGGSNELENLQLAHLHCNHVKGDRVA